MRICASYGNQIISKTPVAYFDKLSDYGASLKGEQSSLRGKLKNFFGWPNLRIAKNFEPKGVEIFATIRRPRTNFAFVSLWEGRWANSPTLPVGEALRPYREAPIRCAHFARYTMAKLVWGQIAVAKFSTSWIKTWKLWHLIESLILAQDERWRCG